MPGIHSAFSRHLFTLNGNVLTSGGAKNLAKGQFTIVKSGSATASGAAVVSSFAGLPKDTVFEMRVGKHKVPVTRTARNSKPYASETFKLSNIVSVKANAPKTFKQTFDEIIIGWDGINDDTAIDILEGQTTVLDITLSGDHIGFITGNTDYTIKMHFGREVGETNQEAILRLVDRLRGQTLPQGVPVTDTIKITPVDSSNGALMGTPYVFSTLTLTDDGTSNALGDIQAQYPLYDVVRTSRDGLTSVYTILHPSAAALADYVQTISSYVKGCEDCAAGYSEIAQGFVYSVQIEDEGADLTTTVDDLPGFVTGSVVKKGNDGSVGFYTVVTDDALTQAEIDTYVGTSGAKSTATITLIGDVVDVCSNSTTVDTAWVDGETCYATLENYKIQLKDDDCDGSRLTELQAAYPDLTIQAGVVSGTSQTLTLTGTSGTAIISIDGVDYTATFNTDLDTTASDFVTAEAAAILAAHGLVVTSGTATLVFTSTEAVFPSTITIANETTDLDGTVAATVYATTETVGGCQGVYSTQVITDIVCDECDIIFLDNFTSEAPAPFEFTEWELIPGTFDENAKMGIRITGKPFMFYPTEVTRDVVPFYETSTRISASGGYIEETSNSFDPHFSDIFNVKRTSRATDRDNLGAQLLALEDASRYYFDGEVRHEANLFAKAVLGEESVLEYTKQYVSYEVEIQDSKRSQGVGRSSDFGTTYTIWAPFGQHNALEDYINLLAVATGLDTVQVTAE